MSTATDVITPKSPAMRRVINALNLAQDALEDAAYRPCSDCERAAEGRCDTHLADLDEVDQLYALRVQLSQARTEAEVAALLAGTGVTA